MASIQNNRSWNYGTDFIQKSETIVAPSVISDDRSSAIGNAVPIGGATILTMTVVKSLVKTIYISTDTDITITLNTSPTDSIFIKAGGACQWSPDNGLTNPFTANFSQMVISNNGATVAQVSTRILTDL